MSYALHLVADNLILQIITGNYTESELKTASQEMAAFMDKAVRDSYILLDLSNMKSIESHLVLVKNAVRPLINHSKLKLLLAYGSSDTTINTFMVGFMASIIKIPVKTFRKQEEAVKYLLNQDPSLDTKLQAKIKNISEQST